MKMPSIKPPSNYKPVKHGGLYLAAIKRNQARWDELESRLMDAYRRANNENTR